VRRPKRMSAAPWWSIAGIGEVARRTDSSGPRPKKIVAMIKKLFHFEFRFM
jgi:hypothetical protein